MDSSEPPNAPPVTAVPDSESEADINIDPEPEPQVEESTESLDEEVKKTAKHKRGRAKSAPNKKQQNEPPQTRGRSLSSSDKPDKENEGGFFKPIGGWTVKKEKSRSRSKSKSKSRSPSPRSKKSSSDTEEPVDKETSHTSVQPCVVTEEPEPSATVTSTYKAELYIPSLPRKRSEDDDPTQTIDFTGGCTTGIQELVRSGKAVPHKPIDHPYHPENLNVDIRGLVSFFECEIKKEMEGAEKVREAHDELMKHKRNSLNIPPRSIKYGCQIEKATDPEPSTSNSKRSSITEESQTTERKPSLMDAAVGSLALILSKTLLDIDPEEDLIELESQAELDSFLQTTGPNALVLVEFYADWCGPCQIMLQFFAEFARELPKKYDVKFAKINVDKCSVKEINVKYGVKEVPTLLLFRDSKVLDKFTGGVSKKKSKKQGPVKQQLMDFVMKHYK